MRPYAQGKLDSLCGLYAIVNAFQCVAAIDDDQSQEFFGSLIRSLDSKKLLVPALLNGTNVDVLIRCMNETLRVSEAMLGVDIGYCRPFRHGFPFGNIQSFLTYLNQMLGADTVAIVGIEGPYDHWSVVRKCRTGLVFHDSAGLNGSSLLQFSLGMSHGKPRIVPEETVLVTREFIKNFGIGDYKPIYARHARSKDGASLQPLRIN